MLSDHTDVKVNMEKMNQLLSDKFTIGMDKWVIDNHNLKPITIFLLNPCINAKDHKISPENVKPIEFFKKFNATITRKDIDYAPLSSYLIVSLEKTVLPALIKALKQMPNASKDARRPHPDCAISPHFMY